MKRKIIMLVSLSALVAAMLTGCASADSQTLAETQTTAGTQEAETQETEAEEAQTTAGTQGTEREEEPKAAETPEQTEPASETEADTEATEEKPAASAVTLEDGVYTAEFDTDSSMFHVSEACDGKGTLTVENGEMVLHVSLASKNIVNLFPGLAEDARRDGAELLEPTVDSVTYSDGITEEVYGFDIPVPVLDEEFDLALVGTKGKWYDHKVSVSNPEKPE